MSFETDPSFDDDLDDDEDDDEDAVPALLPFDRWLALAPSVHRAPGPEGAALLDAAGIDLRTWKHTDLACLRALAADHAAGRWDRLDDYAARNAAAHTQMRSEAPPAPASDAIRPDPDEVPVVIAAPRAQPFQDETREGVVIHGSDLPFRTPTGPRSEPAAREPSPPRSPTDSGDTVMLLEEITPGPPLPFGPADPAAASWTIERYASFCRELVAAPERAPQILAAYGLATSALRQSVDAHFRGRMRTDDALRERFDKLFRPPRTPNAR